MSDLNSSNNFNGSAAGAMSMGAKLTFATIILFFVIVAFFILLHLYATWHSHRQGTFVFRPEGASVRPPCRGLEPSIIQSIPVVVFHPKEFKDGLECAVCLSELSEGEEARLLPKCNHGFHLKCIDMWFKSHSTCPLCRNPIALESLEIQVPEVNPKDGYSAESRNFPTNQINESGSSDVGESGSSSSSYCSATSASSEGDGRVVINMSFSFPLPSSVQFPEEESKSPTALNRLKSLKRLLSGEKRVIPCSPTGFDAEQGLKVQSTQVASDS